MAGKNDHRCRSHRNPMRNSSTYLCTPFFLVKNNFDISKHLVLFYCLISIALSQASDDSLANTHISLKLITADRRYEIFSPSFSSGNRWKSALWNMRMNF